GSIQPGSESYIKDKESIENKYISSCFINIVEEPEQNLFPSSQKIMLNSLLEFNNSTLANKLILTTHSPYIINYLTLAIEAHTLINTCPNKDKAKELVSAIVPLTSAISGDDLVIYELNDKGEIIKLGNYEGIPSSENYLNAQLAEGNNLFSDLLEIEDLCQ
ncbi:MAG: AAA family ATPase, partial [Bacteroidia bacterium]